ncbi:GNAT family N-acetyltransferase [Litorihabitans aurantiacus]|nr:GNAT family N-acetyltransferase [Litorihabitans aurantiacus]
MGDIRAHVAAHLSTEAFARHLADADVTIVLACDVGDVPLGYALVRTGASAAADDGAPAGAGDAPAELSKCYVLPRAQGAGVARALVAAVVERASRDGADHLWLGVNGRNAGAAAFYARAGFAVVGERTYRVGEVDHRDHVMVRPLPAGVAD